MVEELFIQRIALKRVPQEEKNSYYISLPAVAALAGDGVALQSRVTFFCGENGTGKSTLLEAVACAYGFNPEGGSRNFSFSTKSTHAGLYRFLLLSKSFRRPSDGFFLRAESFYNVATEVDRLEELGKQYGLPSMLPSYGGKSLHAQSHGESFLSMVLSRFRGGGLYILDEPEAALSPSRQLTLLYRIHALARQGAQFLIASHSPILMACPGAEIFEMSDAGICPTLYQETEHYRLTRAFLDNPQRILRDLLGEENS